MADRALVIATGRDRPGVLDELSEFLLECGGNVVDIRSVNLAGGFALLLLVQAESSGIATIQERLPKLVDSGIRAEIHAHSDSTTTAAATFPFRFVASGRDQAGVLHRVSHLLKALNINIETIETHVASEGDFRLSLNLQVPRETPISMLKDYLMYLCAELGIKGELGEV
jgi:glycine cleavage system transcriptional repressor